MVVKKKKLSKSERYRVYEEMWVNAKVKPTMSELEKATGVSRRQIYRDLVGLGYKGKDMKSESSKGTDKSET